MSLGSDTQPPEASSPEAPGGSAAPPGPAQKLGDRAAAGAAISIVQTVASKLVSTVGQVVLAWLLGEKDFGLVGLAYTIFAFATLVQQLGLNEILVQRGRQLGRWGNAAFWMSLASGGVAGALMVVAAPFAARLYHAPDLVGVVAVIALSCPLSALSTVPLARLQHDMRFRTLNWVMFWVAVSQVALSVVFALMHFGVYSFVLPRPIAFLAQALVLWRERPVKLHWRPHLRRWRFLLSDSRLVFVSWIFYALVAQGDYVALGIFHTPEVVGIYYFGFNLSFQLHTLFTQSIWRVLLPVLSRLQESPRVQLASYLRAIRAMGVITTPGCLLMAALASPGMHLVFKHKWDAAIPVVQALSAGMTFSVIGTTGHVLLQAQGRFRTLMLLSQLCFGLFAVLVLPAAGLSNASRAASAVALAVGVYHVFYGPISLYGGVRPLGGTGRDVVRVYAAPVLTAAGAIALGVIVAWPLAHLPAGNLLVILVVSLVSGGLYCWLIQITAPAACAELRQRLTTLFSRFRPAPGTCRVCGYDLRATPDRCPECGTAAARTIDGPRTPASGG